MACCVRGLAPKRARRGRQRDRNTLACAPMPVLRRPDDHHRDVRRSAPHALPIANPDQDRHLMIIAASPASNRLSPSPHPRAGAESRRPLEVVSPPPTAAPSCGRSHQSGRTVARTGGFEAHGEARQRELARIDRSASTAGLRARSPPHICRLTPVAERRRPSLAIPVASRAWSAGRRGRNRLSAIIALTSLGPALAARSPIRFVRRCRNSEAANDRALRGRTGEGWRNANIEQWARSWSGAWFSLGNAVPDRLQPEEAVSVPVRAGDRLGDLRKAAVDAAIPGVAVVEDHDPLQAAVPFPDQQSAGLEPDALARRRPAGRKGTRAPQL